jgi:hypothetical protein
MNLETQTWKGEIQQSHPKGNKRKNRVEKEG